MSDTMTLDEALAGFTSADPSIRDGSAYESLRQHIKSGLPAADVKHVAAQLTEQLRHDASYARSFAPLGFCLLVNAGHWDKTWWALSRNGTWQNKTRQATSLRSGGCMLWLMVQILWVPVRKPGVFQDLTP